MQAFNYIDMWFMFLCLTYTTCWFWFLLHFVFLLNYWVFSWMSHGLYRYHILLEWFSVYWLERHMGFSHKCLSFPKSLILSSLLQFWLCPQTIRSEDISETLLQVPFFFFYWDKSHYSSLFIYSYFTFFLEIHFTETFSQTWKENKPVLVQYFTRSVVISRGKPAPNSGFTHLL